MADAGPVKLIHVVGGIAKVVGDSRVAGLNCVAPVVPAIVQRHRPRRRSCRSAGAVECRLADSPRPWP